MRAAFIVAGIAMLTLSYAVNERGVLGNFGGCPLGYVICCEQVTPANCEILLADQLDPTNYQTYEAWLKAVRNHPAYIGEDGEEIWIRAIVEKETFYPDQRGQALIVLNKKAIQKKYWPQ